MTYSSEMEVSSPITNRIILKTLVLTWHHQLVECSISRLKDRNL